MADVRAEVPGPMGRAPHGPGDPGDEPMLSAGAFALAVAALAAAALAVHLVAGSGITGPTVVFDETGYLGNARWLARAGAGWEMPTAPKYALGYPLVIAPVTRLFTDPGHQWRAILVVNAGLLALLVPLLALVARRVLGATRGPALAAAAVGAVAPAAVAAGVSAIAENLALPLVTATVLALHLVRRGAGPLAYLFGPSVALLYATHPRFAPALVIGIAALAIGLRRQLIRTSVAVGNIILLVAGTAVAWLGSRQVESARWAHVERLEGRPSDVIELGTSGSGLGELASTAVGQAWYLGAGSLGLVVVGTAGLVLALRRGGASTGHLGSPARTGVGAAGDVDRLAIGYLLAVAASVLAVSVAFFAQNQFRADHLVYGRHNDSFTPLWMTAAVLTLWCADRRHLLRLGALAGGTVVALFTVLSVVRDPEAYGGFYSAFAVPALIRVVPGDPAGTFWRATALALVGLVVIVGLIALGRRPMLAVPLLVVWSVWSGFGTVRATESFDRTIYEGWEVPADVARLGIDSVAIDVHAVNAAFPALTYPFHLPGIRFTTFDEELGDDPRSEVVVLTRADNPARRASPDRLALVDPSGYLRFWGAEAGIGLWVLPGAEQDRLAAAGLLLPRGFPTGLPDGARQAGLSLTDGRAGTEVEVAQGGSIEVPLRGRHTGSSSPWPGAGAWNGPAGVRVVASVTGIDRGLPDGARAGGPVPGWVVPGERFATTATVFAADHQLRPLPPGRYQVELGVGQDQPEWTSPPQPEASFTMVVTEG